MIWLHYVQIGWTYGPATPDFTKVKDVYPVVSFFKITFQTNYLKIHQTYVH